MAAQGCVIISFFTGKAASASNLLTTLASHWPVTTHSRRSLAENRCVKCCLMRAGRLGEMKSRGLGLLRAVSSEGVSPMHHRQSTPCEKRRNKNNLEGDSLGLTGVIAKASFSLHS